MKRASIPLNPTEPKQPIQPGAPRENPGEPGREPGPTRAPWEDPDPDVGKVSLPPNSPSPGVPVEPPSWPTVPASSSQV